MPLFLPNNSSDNTVCNRQQSFDFIHENNLLFNINNSSDNKITNNIQSTFSAADITDHTLYSLGQAKMTDHDNGSFTPFSSLEAYFFPSLVESVPSMPKLCDPRLASSPMLSVPSHSNHRIIDNSNINNDKNVTFNDKDILNNNDSNRPVIDVSVDEILNWLKEPIY